MRPETPLKVWRDRGSHRPAVYYPAPRLYLGAPDAYWASNGQAQGPLFISVKRWLKAKSAGRATVPVAIDSGAFTEISTHGRWTISAEDYAAQVSSAALALGTVEWAAIQDWMCEPWILAKTGLTLEEHQRRTVTSLIDLRRIAPKVSWLPILQGFSLADYERCAELYRSAGVDLQQEPLVGLGSVCRRSGSAELATLLADLRSNLGLHRLHGFGVKSAGVLASVFSLKSCDSMSWSYQGRKLEQQARKALGLPVDAPRDEVLAAFQAAWVVPDKTAFDFLQWKAQDTAAWAQNSQSFAEEWRAAQLAAISETNAGREQSFWQLGGPRAGSLVVYLAGPINGRPDHECSNWRDEAANMLHLRGHGAADPMLRDYRGRELDPGVAREIVEGDKHVIQLVPLWRCSTRISAASLSLSSTHSPRRKGKRSLHGSCSTRTPLSVHSAKRSTLSRTSVCVNRNSTPRQ